MKEFVKKVYGTIAKESKQKKKCCCAGSGGLEPPASKVSEKIGYSPGELTSIPEEADMGLGCGNPVALASIREGETVVDLGSGGGIDVFLAARKVGEKGKVIGIDMTQEMIERAMRNADKIGLKNVEFRLGDIENIPLEDRVADCVISNCVINLADDKQRVFNEAYRILKQGGRLMVSDMVLTRDLPDDIRRSAAMFAGCVAGALRREDYLGKIWNAGFEEVNVVSEAPIQLLDYIGSDKVLADTIQNFTEDQIQKVNNTVVSVKISARK